MSKYTPKKLEKRIAKAYKKYEEMIQEIADDVYTNRLVPYCIEHKLSFIMMNGIPRFVNQDGDYINMPKWMQNLCDVSDEDGNRLIWCLKEYKYQEVDFNKVDIDHWDRYYKNVPLAAIMFGPVLSRIC